MRITRIHTSLPRLTLLAMTSLVVACSDSDLLIDGDYQDATPVEILPSLGSQSFDVSLQETRSTGAFDKWSLDAEHWRNAEFRTFGLKTGNALDADYDFSNRANAVMYNQLMRIKNGNGAVGFYDNDNPTQEIHRYYDTHRRHRYKFFTYYTDDAIVGTPMDSKDSITVSIDGITGYQDLLHGFAYHTDSDLQTLISRMPDNDYAKMFTEGNGGREFLYSAVSGNLGVHPQFHLNHLMAQFDVKVQGKVGNNNDKKYSFLQVIIDTLTLQAPHKGTMTIAHNKWNNEADYKRAVANHEIINWDDTPFDYHPRLRDQRLTGNEPYLLGLKDYNVDFASLWEEMYNSLNFERARTYHQVGSDLPVTLCDSILLPPMDSILLHFGYDYMFIEQDATGKWVLNQEQTSKNSMNSGRKPYIIKMANGQPFKPGGLYTILITIYGPEQVSIEAIHGDIWKQGGDIDLDNDY